ncbi:hypothetical protein AMJ57_04740 [Parcubacteria bacterium SG8_24]|nr:MAG: hypothetical protein AMJ57_04740 [Parcubacteria bacterium SG8_24]
MLFRDLIAYLSIIVILALAVLIVVGVNMYTALKPERYFSTVTPRNFGLDYRPITLKTADGVSIAGWHIPSQDGPAAAAIVALHGYPADKGDLLAHTVFLADTFDLLLIDFRYFGESGGDFSTVGAREVAEYEAAVTYLRDLGFEKVGVYGFSMGGAVALMGAAGPVRADAVVAEAAYQDLADASGRKTRLGHRSQGSLPGEGGVRSRHTGTDHPFATGPGRTLRERLGDTGGPAA